MGLCQLTFSLCRQENHQELQDAHRAMGVEVDNLREDGGSKKDLGNMAELLASLEQLR